MHKRSNFVFITFEMLKKQAAILSPSNLEFLLPTYKMDNLGIMRTLARIW